MRDYLYVSVSGEDRIAVFGMDDKNGRLEHIFDLDVPDKPYPMAIDPHKRHLYVGRLDTNEISSFEIDNKTGRIHPLGDVGLDSAPCYLSTDRTGRYMLSACYESGEVAVHSIMGNGAVGDLLVGPNELGYGAHCIQTDPSNRFAYVSCIAGESGANAVFQFRFDVLKGNLIPNHPAMLTPDVKLGPRHFCFHPKRDFVYFTNEQGCSVSAYHFDYESGVLESFQTVSTLPEGYTCENTCSQIQISPSGKFLYAPNRGHNSVACFSVADRDGRLTPIQRVSTEEVPRALCLDTRGEILYVAGEESGRMASYSIEPSTGKLNPNDVYDIGDSPMWVLSSRF